MEPEVLPPRDSVTQPPAVPRSRAGARVAMGIALVGVIGIGVFTGVRVKQAIAKREQLAGERVTAQAASTHKPPVKVTHPTATKWRPHVDMTGTLKPWREAEVGFETSGRLVKVLVATGDVVRDHQTLAYLDGARAGETVAIKEASVRAAAANLAMAEDALKRTEALVLSKSIPEAQAEQARQQVALTRAQFQAAQADVQLARTGAGQNAIFAPFAGVVTRAPTAGGGVVAPGTPLVRVEDLSRLRLSATVGEDDVSLVAVGAKVVVRYRERAVDGKVIAVVPSLDQATRRAPVEIEVPNDKNAPLMAWGFVRATLGAGAEVDALSLPATARRPGSQDEVVKIEGGKAHVVRVTQSMGEDGSWVIRQGLAAGDTILVSPSSEIKDGDPVTDTELGP